MQNTDTASQRYGSAPAAQPVAAPVTSEPEVPQASLASDAASSQNTIIDVQDITLTSALPVGVAGTSISPAPNLRQSNMASVLPQPAPAPTSPAVEASSCEIAADAVTQTGATVSLSLSAPCHSDQKVTVHHAGMFFSEKTDAQGTLKTIVPALAADAVFIFAFADGKGAVAQADVSDLFEYNRVVLQWRGDAGFELHAREFGANYGEEGHVWRGVDQNVDTLVAGKGGYLSALGRVDVTEPQVAEVYSFPSSMSGRNGHIDLSIEAEINTRNCGLEIEAQALELTREDGLRTRNLTLAVPGCDAIGDYLVLNNVFEDMKVAAR